MELNGWQHGQRQGKGSLSLIPPTWDTVSDLYREVLKFVSRFPFRKRLVLYFVFRGTSVKIDLGDVKAAGVVCVLGIGFSLGSFLIYKLYCKYIRPVLNKPPQDCEKTDTQTDDCYFYVDSSDGATNKGMGNANDKTPPAYYDPEYGVAFGTNHNFKKPDVITSEADGVRMRVRKPRRQSSQQSDKDSAIGGTSELGQSFYSDGGINRDSFYSTCTAESGFENMPDHFDDSSSVGDGYTQTRHPSLSHSLQVNFSPKSLKEKHLKYFQGNASENSSTSGDRSAHSQHSLDALERSSVLLTPPSDDNISPTHAPRVGSDKRHSGKQSSQTDQSDKSHSLSAEYDASLDISESLKSFSGGTDSVGDWSWDEDEREGLSPLPHIHSSVSDYQFKQSLLQRLHEWSSYSLDNYSSRSPTPERFSAPPRVVRRSRSLDRQVSEMSTPDTELFDNELIEFSVNTTKNLEHIEGELHDIQDEFSMITSKLSDLIHKGGMSDNPEVGDLPTVPHSPLAQHATNVVHRARTRWERSPSQSYSDSERSSRDGSLELAWDLGDLGDDELPKAIRNRKKNRKLKKGTQRENIDSEDVSKKIFNDVNSYVIKTYQPVHPPGFSPSKESCQVKDSEVASEGLEVDCEPAEHQDCILRPPNPEKPRNRLKNVEEAVDILEYAEREWKGGTDRALLIKQGYAEIPNIFHCRHLRQIRGDNYCAIRSCLYQCLTIGLKVTDNWPDIVSVINNIHNLYTNPSSGLANWNFANRLPYSSDDKLSIICKCVLTLYSTIEEVCKLPSREEREDFITDLLNSDPATDLELMEGVKLLMLLIAVKLHNASENVQEMPVFSWLMFARDTSENVSMLVRNHLNAVGDTGGLEQVEMCLLGQTLETTIRVARLQNYNQEDFVCYFPDDGPKDWPHLDLVAEDDRHYNVPIP